MFRHTGIRSARRGFVFAGLLLLATWTTKTLWPLPGVADRLWDFGNPTLAVVWAPTILALLFLWWEGGRSLVQRELRARLRYRADARWMLLALATPLVAVGAGVAVARVMGDGAPTIPVNMLGQAVLIQLLVGGLGEELGWRGYLVSRLGEWMGPTQAVPIAGALWALWHVPALMRPAVLEHPVALALAFLNMFLIGTFLGFLLHRCNGSIVPAILSHLSLHLAASMGGARIQSVWLWGTCALVFALANSTMLWQLRGVKQRISSVVMNERIALRRQLVWMLANDGRY